jgi:ribosomal protein S18 acetylase RimI-like enzyme
MTTVQNATTAPILTPAALDEDRAIAVLVLAFSSDPACRWTWPDPRQYIESFPTFVRALAGQAFGQGTAYCTRGYTGAALWLPPGINPDEDALAAMVRSTVAEDDQELLFSVMEQMGSYHPSEPHWYLPLIGVDPAQQGRGHGSELMRHALLACDRDGTPAYLESSNSKNIPLYERHGFELLGTIEVGASPPIFPMLRKPR